MQHRWLIFVAQCRSGVNVPGIRMVDATEGALGIEWIEGRSVRHLLPGGSEEDENAIAEELKDEDINIDPLKEYGITVGRDQPTCFVFRGSRFLGGTGTLMMLIGVELAKMHAADVIHGDLTTSNMMLRHPTSFTPRDANTPTQLVSCLLQSQ